MASSTAPRRGFDVLLTTLDHPGAGVARDGGGEQREYDYHVFQELCAATICKEPLFSQLQQSNNIKTFIGGITRCRIPN